MRKITEVACGVLVEPSTGRFLLGSRPEGKPYAGYWEFPGGKLEAGETVHEALARELKEELDLTIGPSYPWFVMEHDYPHAYVRLHFRRCFAWKGTIRALENQEYAWFAGLKDISSLKLLPMDALIVKRIFLPSVVKAHDLNNLATYEGLDPREGAICGTREELKIAAKGGVQYAICRKGAEAELLSDQMNGVPLYVIGEGSSLQSALEQGAHGVVELSSSHI